MHPHNSVNVTGGTQIQRQLAYDLVEHCVDQMLPRHRTLWIEVELKKIPDKDKVVGYCQDAVSYTHLRAHETRHELV